MNSDKASLVGPAPTSIALFNKIINATNENKSFSLFWIMIASAGGFTLSEDGAAIFEALKSYLFF